MEKECHGVNLILVVGCLVSRKAWGEVRREDRACPRGNELVFTRPTRPTTNVASSSSDLDLIMAAEADQSDLGMQMGLDDEEEDGDSDSDSGSEVSDTEIAPAAASMMQIS